MAVGFRVGWIFAQHVKRCELAMFHGFKHIAQMPASFGMDLYAPGLLILGADFIVLNVLKAGEAVRNGAHVTAALNIVLAAQWAHTATITAYVAGENGKIDQRDHVVGGVVMFSDTQRPAKLCAGRFRVGMVRLTDHFRGNARLTLSSIQSVFLHVHLISLKSTGGMLDELFIGQPSRDNFAAHRICQDRKSTRLNSSHTVIYTLSLHDALPIFSPRAPYKPQIHWWHAG